MIKERKRVIVAVTCTPAEREELHRKAAAEGVKFTDWARLILLNTTLKDVLLNKK